MENYVIGEVEAEMANIDGEICHGSLQRPALCGAYHISYGVNTDAFNSMQ